MSDARCTSVWTAFADTAARYPDRPYMNVLAETAAIYDISAGEITYGRASETARTLAAKLAAAGYGRGHRVMLLLENRPAYFTWWLALNSLGASVVPLNPDLRHAELTYMISHAKPALIVTLPARAESLTRAADAAEMAVPVIAPDAEIPTPGNAGAAALRTGSNGEVLDGEHLEAALLYTSGTTGHPKGCILTNTYYLEAGQWYATTGGLCVLTNDGERMVTALPLFHMNAMAYSFMAMVAVGGCLTVLDRFHPTTWWQSVRAANASCIHYLGVMPSMLMSAASATSDREHTVRFGFGAGVDPELHAAFEARFGFPLIEAWAMTETGAGAVICANRQPRRIGESCLGKPEAPLEIRIVDEQGEDAVNAPGELLVRQSGDDPRRGFFAGYYANAEATAEAWSDGWFHTGDIVRQDRDGALFFVDRKKNVIRRSGENIAAVEVESTLMRHPAIVAAGVTAVPDAVRGDEVFACLKVNVAANQAAANDIVIWCLSQLAYYKAPGYVHFVDALPLTATQKIQRSTLKALAVELVSDPATIDTRHLKKRSAA